MVFIVTAAAIGIAVGYVTLAVILGVCTCLLRITYNFWLVGVFICMHCDFNRECFLGYVSLKRFVSVVLFFVVKLYVYRYQFIGRGCAAVVLGSL